MNSSILSSRGEVSHCERETPFIRSQARVKLPSCRCCQTCRWTQLIFPKPLTLPLQPEQRELQVELGSEMETALAGFSNKICFITGKGAKAGDELLIWTRRWPATDQGGRVHCCKSLTALIRRVSKLQQYVPHHLCCCPQGTSLQTLLRAR